MTEVLLPGAALGMKISTQTYDDHYLTMDLPESMLPRLVLPQINGAWLLKDPMLPGGWGWMTDEDFHEHYTWSQDHEALKLGMVQLSRISEAWE